MRMRAHVFSRRREQTRSPFRPTLFPLTQAAPKPASTAGAAAADAHPFAASARAGTRRAPPAWKEAHKALPLAESSSAHTKPARPPRGSLWERMFF